MTTSINIVSRLLETTSVNIYNKETKKVLVTLGTREYYCNICAVGLHGPQFVVEQHVGGKRHRRYFCILNFIFLARVSKSF